MSYSNGKWGYRTTLNGITFRSTLEAEWAQFFNLHHMEWEYEPETFDLDGVRYLPDFWFPKIRCVVEVKGVCDEDDIDKLTRFSIHAGVLGVSTLVVGSMVGRGISVVATSPECLGTPPLGFYVPANVDILNLIQETPYKHLEECEGIPIHTGLMPGVHFFRCKTCGAWGFAEFETRPLDACTICGAQTHQFHEELCPCDCCGAVMDPALLQSYDDPMQVYWNHLNSGSTPPIYISEFVRYYAGESNIMAAMEIACRRVHNKNDRGKYVNGILKNILRGDQSDLPVQFDFDWVEV